MPDLDGWSMTDEMRANLKKVFDSLLEMPREEFDKMLQEEIDKYEPCGPDTCGGECQGTGHCEVAVAFQTKYFGAPFNED